MSTVGCTRPNPVQCTLESTRYKYNVLQIYSCSDKLRDVITREEFADFGVMVVLNTTLSSITNVFSPEIVDTGFLVLFRVAENLELSD